MNLEDTSNIFICSFCEQSLKFRSDQEGKRVRCPKCNNFVWLFDNRSALIASKLSSSWTYERPKLLGLLGSQMIGPITDSEFLSLLARGEIQRDANVMSPELTMNQEVPLAKINISFIREMCNQRAAEEQRLKKLRIRESQKNIRNRETLLQGIRKAISDGNLSLNERNKLQAFAEQTGIPNSELENLLRSESTALMNQVVDEAISDGIYDEKENERLSAIAIGLGLTLQFSKDQQFRIELARIAWNILQQLQSGGPPEYLECHDVEMFEIVALKRPAGIALGNDHYLKSVANGDLKRGDKHLMIEGRLSAKKYALSSVIDIKWYSDGLFVKRSSGKSLFLRPTKLNLSWYEFAMTLEAITTGEPVLGILPDESFIPSAESPFSDEVGSDSDLVDMLTESDLVEDAWSPTNRIPRFTFRVVGEDFDDRLTDLDQLSIGETVYLKREPSNVHDQNAVAVVNSQRRMLGYLKREVALWFAPILDRGRKFQCEVKQRTASGGIVISVFD
jgi:tellurite resistance protein/DNA-directed RNA polymerase subunit RPC12/RpoP